MKGNFDGWLTYCAVLAGVLLHSPKLQAGFINGDFETGDLTGWSTQLFYNGTMGGPGFPGVAPFETRQGEVSQAAFFNVGRLNSSHFGLLSGGGIYQNLFLPAGPYRVTADIAAANNTTYISDDAGQFVVELDDMGGWPYFLGRIYPNTIIRDRLSVDLNVPTTGTHKIWILIVRDGGNSTNSSWQYIDNVQIASLIPEPSAWGLVPWGCIATLFFLRGQRRY